MKQKTMSATTKGILIALVLIVINVIVYTFKLQENTVISLLGMGLYLAGIIWVCISYSNENNANVTFGNLFGYAFKSVATITVLSLVFTLLLVFVIDPNIKAEALRKAAISLETNKDLNEAQRQQAVKLTDKFFYAFMIGGSLLYYILLGLIFSLIGAAVAKKNPQPLTD